MAEGPITSLLSRWGMGSGRSSAAPHLEGSNIDRRTLEKLQRLLEKLVKSCDNPALALKRSPPYLLDLLPHMYQTLQEIFKLHENKMQELNNNEYFRLFIDNVCNKLKRGLKLFKDNRNVFNESSTERKTLTRLSLHISHMLYEIKALFPNNVYMGSSYRITKEEAEEFWKANFGDKTIVLWKDFRTALSLVHPITSSYEAMALKSTIDLTHNDMVSVFEFDVFTRLFQPWNTLLINWKMIAVTHTGYQAFLTYGEVKEKLQRWVHKPGTYIFRLSCTRLGQWAIGYVTTEHEILQTIPQNKSLCEALILGAQDGYYLYPDGKEQNPDLSVIQQEKQKKVIQVSEEEYEIYFSMGSTFQQCKICQENDKDVKLEPCSHLLCSECLFAWQEHDKSASLTCPFCRAQVKDYEHIEIDPFQKQQALQQAMNMASSSSTSNGDIAQSSWSPHQAPPPIPDRNTGRSNSSVRPPPPELAKMPQASPVSNRQAIAPPPSVPRRSEDPAPLLNSPPSRPPPLPPSLGTMPSESRLPVLPDQPPPIPGQPPPHLPPPLPDMPPPLPNTQPPLMTDTPGDASFTSEMSSTNPFFSDMQALRAPVPPSTAPPVLIEEKYCLQGMILTPNSSPTNTLQFFKNPPNPLFLTEHFDDIDDLEDVEEFDDPEDVEEFDDPDCTEDVPPVLPPALPTSAPPAIPTSAPPALPASAPPALPASLPPDIPPDLPQSLPPELPPRSNPPPPLPKASSENSLLNLVPKIMFNKHKVKKQKSRPDPKDMTHPDINPLAQFGLVPDRTKKEEKHRKEPKQKPPKSPKSPKDKTNVDVNPLAEFGLQPKEKKCKQKEPRSPKDMANVDDNPLAEFGLHPKEKVKKEKHKQHEKDNPLAQFGLVLSDKKQKKKAPPLPTSACPPLPSRETPPPPTRPPPLPPTPPSTDSIPRTSKKPTQKPALTSSHSLPPRLPATPIPPLPSSFTLPMDTKSATLTSIKSDASESSIKSLEDGGEVYEVNTDFPTKSTEEPKSSTMSSINSESSAVSENSTRSLGDGGEEINVDLPTKSEDDEDVTTEHVQGNTKAEGGDGGEALRKLSANSPYADVTYLGQRGSADGQLRPQHDGGTMFSKVTDTGPVLEDDSLYNDPVNAELVPDKSKLPLFGTSRNLESITPSSWSSALFDEDTPPPPSHDDHSLYCNFDTAPQPLSLPQQPQQPQQPQHPQQPQQPQQPQLNYDNYPEPMIYSNVPDIVQHTSEPSPVMSTHPGLSNPPTAGLGIANIALRPSSIVDPDNWLFDGDGTGNSREDIYENQESSEPPPQTTSDRLIAQGYSAEDVSSATNIVGDNYDMALMILKSFR